MQINKKVGLEIQSEDITNLLNTYFSSLMAGFYEMQSSFLSGIYKRYNNIESAHIILCLAEKTHLEILRQREKSMNHVLSLKNFWNNYKNITNPTQKIVSIVKTTGIPKETARRKIKNLISQDFVLFDKNIKEYSWNLLLKYKESYLEIYSKETKILSTFVSTFAEYLKLPLNKDLVIREIESQFSFYWYHFLACQLKWLKMWQEKIKDIDLILISLQAVIPTLQYIDKNINLKKIGLDNLYMIVGQTNNQYKFSEASVSAASVSEITGIPRATCIRKLERLAKLELLERDGPSKRFFISQLSINKTKYIFFHENINLTVQIFSEFLCIILNNLTRQKKIVA